jgi:RNA recognition motif-containing protein
MPKVYVGNLADSVTSEDLFIHFSRAGEVVAALAITDKATGRCRGFGFVEMAEFADVPIALGLLNHTVLKGQSIRIEPDQSTKNGKARNRAV